MKNILLKIAYDGTNFCGWQRQPDKRTVCGELERVLSSLSGEKIKLDGTSRTDAGVHALGQCASFKSNIKIPVEKLPAVLNRAMAEDRLEGISDICVLEAKEMPDDFHARFSSKGKRYMYKLKTGSDKSIFDRNYYYQVGEDLNVAAMEKAAGYIVGEHDFAAFQASGSPKESTVRTIYDIKLERTSDNLTLLISGNGFLYNMVRIIMGTLVEVGLGKLDPDEVKEIIESKNRSRAGHTAPPQGLYLEEVFYE